MQRFIKYFGKRASVTR